MTNEFQKCNQTLCWIPRLLAKGYVAIWPLFVAPEIEDGFLIWSFYVQWNKSQGTKVNHVKLCDMHSMQVLHIFETEAAYDVREQEMTEKWLVKTKSRM